MTLNETSRPRLIGLLLLGLIFHVTYLFSIFDIYFRSPLVHGMTPLRHPREAPAHRLVLFVADGLRADRLFEQESNSPGVIMPRAPYLKSIVQDKGRWGVSHTRVPTESRPGHVAVIAGFYEDVSAVTKGWKLNPVTFDSVFNQSHHTWSFGSPDILPMFSHGASDASKIETFMYPPEFEDFSTDATHLDTWVFDKVNALFDEAEMNQTLKSQLTEKKIVFFLHLLGLDTHGHAFRPHSKQYVDNIRYVDRMISKFVHRLESFYNDNATAFVFTADHGMSNQGSHGDGNPDNTRTPLIVWGAGVPGPDKSSAGDHDSFSESWGLNAYKRNDVRQADIAPLMSYLIGIPIPVNSVGVIPSAFWDATPRDKAVGMLINAKQILAQYQVLSWMLLVVALWPLSMPLKVCRNHMPLLVFWSAVCLIMAIFPVLPLDRLEDMAIVNFGGALLLISGLVGLIYKRQRIDQETKPLYQDVILWQLLLTVMSLVVVNDTVKQLSLRKGLPSFNLYAAWILLVVSLAVPFLHGLGTREHFLTRLLLLYLSFGAPFVILSISYELTFYALFGWLLLTWILVERHLYATMEMSAVDAHDNDEEEAPKRPLKVRDARAALFFLFFVNLAFFGTGNIASVSSFSLESVYRLIPVFDPFSMGALLLLRILVPFFLLSAAFGVVARSLQLPPFSLFLLVFATTDVMTLNFFYLVRDDGSWLEIGTSISHFFIAGVFIVFTLLLFSLSSLLVGHVQVGGSLKRKGKKLE